jgi:hypothetical protein
MPPRLRDYDLKAWSRLRPLTHALKTRRYRRVDAAYAREPARDGSVGALLAHAKGRKLLLTIGFADAQAIDWQAELVRHFLPDVLYAVADNSLDDASAAAIKFVAGVRGVPYLRLPPNRWPEGSRSHGLALNWLWHNVVLPAEPEAFGFLDDDVFPTAADDPFGPLQSQDFHGWVREAGDRWFLWAGLCVFRFDRVRGKPLDFGQDWFNGLDTGGGNWEVLYRHVDRASLQQMPNEFRSFKSGLDWSEAPLQWCGSWLHEVGWLGRPDLNAEKRRVVGDILAPHLAAARAARGAAD